MKCVVCSTGVDENGCEYIELMERCGFIRDHKHVKIRISYMCSPQCFRVFINHRGHVEFPQHSIVKVIEE